MFSYADAQVKRYLFSKKIGRVREDSDITYKNNYKTNN